MATEYAVEVTRLDEGKVGTVMFRQVFDEEAFDLPAIVAGVNGIQRRKRSAAPARRAKKGESA